MRRRSIRTVCGGSARDSTTMDRSWTSKVFQSVFRWRRQPLQQRTYDRLDEALISLLGSLLAEESTNQRATHARANQQRRRGLGVHARVDASQPLLGAHVRRQVLERAVRAGILVPHLLLVAGK